MTQVPQMRFPWVPRTRAFGLLLLAVAVSLFAISHLLLGMAGFRYEVPGGSIVEKIHPATWLAILALAVAVLRSGHPLLWLDHVVRRHKGLLFFAFANAVLLWHLIMNQKMPFTGLVDTFFLPMTLVLLLEGISERQRATLERAIHVLMAANALLGIYEVATGWHFTPLIIGELVQTDDWRATALMGHPLNNAAVTAHYLLAIALGGAHAVSRPVRVALFVLNLAALNAFGGRVAFVLAMLLLSGIAAWRFLGVLRGARFAPSTAAFISLALPVGLAVVALLYDAGAFDRFLTRFVSDKGSAEARLIMLELFRSIPERELVFGPNAAQVAQLMRMEGLVGLESFWVAFVLSYGLAVSLLFFSGLFAFLWDLVKTTSPRAMVLVLFFLLEATTSVSVSAKTTTFAMMVFIVMVMLRRRADRPLSNAP